MTILGEIVDLYHAKNHPRFGIGFRSAKEWEEHADEITRQLETYGASLKEFEARYLSIDPNLGKELPDEGGTVTMTAAGNEGVTDVAEMVDAETPSVHSVQTTSSHQMEADIQTRIVVGNNFPSAYLFLRADNPL